MAQISNNGKTITIMVMDAGEDDFSTGMRIPAGVIPDEVFVKQRQENGTILKVRFTRETTNDT